MGLVEHATSPLLDVTYNWRGPGFRERGSENSTRDQRWLYKPTFVTVTYVYRLYRKPRTLTDRNRVVSGRGQVYSGLGQVWVVWFALAALLAALQALEACLDDLVA